MSTIPGVIGILPIVTRDMLYIRDNRDIPLNTLYWIVARNIIYNFTYWQILRYLVKINY